jgi:3',5'-cyclic AMP phosphodiesterase CpdA
LARLNRWTHARIKLFLLISVFSVAGLALAAQPDLLPAQNWNPANLQQIKADPLEPLTFAVLGDNKDNLAVLGKLLQRIEGDPDITFAIHLGDMVQGGDLGRYRRFFREVRQHFQKPLLMVPGNHEIENAAQQKLYQDIFGPDYFAFPINDNYFIVVADETKNGPEEAQLQWLEQQLQQAQKYRTRLVFLHIPLSDPRGGANHHCLLPDCGSRLEALFRKYRVTHVFAAHIHGYFNGAWDGVPYTITGGAGADLYGTDPRHFFFHYLKVTICGEQLQIQVQPLAEKGPS